MSPGCPKLHVGYTTFQERVTGSSNDAKIYGCITKRVLFGPAGQRSRNLTSLLPQVKRIQAVALDCMEIYCQMKQSAVLVGMSADSHTFKTTVNSTQLICYAFSMATSILYS